MRQTLSAPVMVHVATGVGRPRSLLPLAFPWLLLLLAMMVPVHGWPYVDCSGPRPLLSLGSVRAHVNETTQTVDLVLQGNFTSDYLGYSAASTSQWRTSTRTTIMGTELYNGNSPACPMIAGGCPTAPGPGSISTSFPITQSAPFAELMVFLQIVGTNNQSIVCVAVLIEQTMPKANTAISFLPLALATYSGLVGLISTLMRASVGNGFLSAAATYGLASESLHVHTPGFFDIIFYTQFMLMTGQLSINYPSFYSTFTSLFHWSFLEFRDSFAGKGPDNSTEVLAYGGAGSVNQIKDSNNGPNSRMKKRSLPMDSSRVLPAVPRVTPKAPSATGRQAPVPTMALVATAHPWKRQDPATSDVSVEPSPSPSSSLSSTDSSSSTTSSTKSRSKTPSSSSTTSTEPSSKPTPQIVIPTIKDPFSNSEGAWQQYNVSRFGLDAYAAAIGAAPSTLFLCTLINTIMAAGASLFLSAIFLTLAWVMAKENHQKGKTLHHAFNFVTGNVLRVWSLLFTPLALSAMYQLTISGNTLMTVVAGGSIVVFSVGATIFFTWRILRASSELLLLDDLATLLKYGTLYNTLAEEGTLYFLVTLLVRFLWGLAVAMLSSYGIAQVAVLMVVEFGYMLVVGVKWPFSESSDNKFHIFLGISRIVITGCSIAYAHDLKTPTEVRQLFGYIQMALHLVVFIVMFALVVWNTIQIVIFWRNRHLISWKGPTKNYSFEDPAEAEPGWVVTGRPLSSHPRAIGPDPLDSLDPLKARRHTLQPYSSMNGLGPESIRHSVRLQARHEGPYGPWAARDPYRQSRMTEHRRSRFPSNEDQALPLNLRSETILPLSGHAGPISAGSDDSGPALTLQPSPASMRQPSTQRESYARFERMNHQQTTPDLRTRRMSELLRDGPYLNQDASTPRPQGLWANVKKSFGGIFGSRQKTLDAAGDGTKPKAFEVIRRPPLPTLRTTTDDDGSRNGDELRELNSIGISRFFQESDRGYERNRSLFVANPEAMQSQAESLRSSVSGIRPKLDRHGSEAGASVYTISQLRAKGTGGVSSDLGSIAAGIESASEHGTSESRRVSGLSGPVHPRNSVESNIAEALFSEAPLKLQGGGILKVSKGPEKAVQYWRKESGQYVESLAEAQGEPKHQPHPLASPPLLILPSTRGSFLDTIPKDHGTPKGSVARSRSGSRPDSPTGSHHSNVAVSAGKMHEILDRMFSDEDDSDEDISEDNCSTFSGRVSAAILTLQQKKYQEEGEYDGQSIHRSDILEPVQEHLSVDSEGTSSGLDSHGRPQASGSGESLFRTSSVSDRARTGTLVRSPSGASLALALSPSSLSAPSSPSLHGRSLGKSLTNSGRPLAQTPLHSPSVTLMTASSPSQQPLSLNRQSSHPMLSRQPSNSSRPSLSRQSSQPQDNLDPSLSRRSSNRSLIEQTFQSSLAEDSMEDARRSKGEAKQEKERVVRIETTPLS